MNNIVLQICEKFIGEVVGFFGSGKSRTIEEMKKNLKEQTNAFILEIMSTYLESMDKAIVDDKVSRRKQGYVITGNQS